MTFRTFESFPQSGQLVSFIVPHCDTRVFQAFLTRWLHRPPEERRRVILVPDTASWHRAKGLEWQHIEPVYLLPYSPDFNPVEKLWQHPKSH